MQSEREIIKPACAEVNRPVPQDVVCRVCGLDVEVWSDDEDPRCPDCGAELKEV